MAYDQGTTDEELAQMQELSAKYEPEVTVSPLASHFPQQVMSPSLLLDFRRGSPVSNEDGDEKHPSAR